MTPQEFYQKYKNWRHTFEDFQQDLSALISYELNHDERTAMGLLKMVCDCLGEPLNKVQSKIKFREAVDARFVFFRIVREKLDLKVERIGAIFDMDHSSVTYGIRQTYEIKELSQKYNKAVAYINERNND